MTSYRVEIRVKPRPGLLDPEGTAVRHALDSLGFPGVSDVRVGKVIDLEVEADNEPEVIDRSREMCRKLLANPITEDFQVAARPAPDLVEKKA